MLGAQQWRRSLNARQKRANCRRKISTGCSTEKHLDTERVFIDSLSGRGLRTVFLLLISNHVSCHFVLLFDALLSIVPVLL